MNRRLLGSLVAGGAFVMLGVAFAAKPMYDTFCRVTGFGGTTRVAVEKPDQVLDREVNVRFDANVSDVPFQFRPVEPMITTRLGETTLVLYELTNTSDRPVKAVASYNVAPHKTGPYFTKLECFCFQEQVFQPGETMKLPVIFFVNPLMDEERQLDDVHTITLSYTFFRAKDDKDDLAS